MVNIRLHAANSSIQYFLFKQLRNCNCCFNALYSTDNKKKALFVFIVHQNRRHVLRVVRVNCNYMQCNNANNP